MSDGHTLAIECRPGELRLALLDGATPLAFSVERAAAGSLVGSIFAGRVRAVRPEIGAAFVAIGEAQDGFLNIRRSDPVIAEGMAVLVQVDRDAEAGKGPRLTRKVPFSENETAAELRAGPVPRLVRAPAGPAGRLLADYGAGGIDEIVVDDGDLLSDMTAYARERWPDAPPAVRRIHGDQRTFGALGLDDAFAAALEPEVSLPGGGSLIFSETPAMTTVDVNVGGRQAGSGDRLAVETNLAAAAEIARQLRLRAIGGLIAVDFLKLKDRTDRTHLEAAMKKALAGDPADAQVAPVSPFGVVEILRRRAGPSLAAVMRTAAAAPTPETVALEALYAVQRRRGSRARLRLGADAAGLLQGPLATVRRTVEAKLGFDIEIAVSDSVPGGFDIEEQG